jgi:hypothetical protein
VSSAPPKPLLLLDVDGVIIPFGGPAPSFVYPMSSGYVRHRPELPDWLAGLAVRFDLAWATAWEHEANEVIAPVLGLPSLPVLVFDDDVEPGFDYKLPAITRFVRDRPCAWLDDAIGVDAHEWARARAVPTLFLDVAADRGITTSELAALHDFADRLERA